MSRATKASARAWSGRGDGDPGGHHVAVTDRLDLFELVPLGQGVEVAEQVVEEADHLGGRQPLRARREIDQVGEQDGRGGELVGDGLGFRLELLGDGPRQDVEEQVLGAILLDPQCGQGVLSLLREDGEEGEHDRPSDHDVEREHRGPEPDRQRVAAAHHLAGDARPEEDHHEGDEPADAAPSITEDERAQRREDPPQAHPAGGQEPADGDHRHRRREQDVEQRDSQQERGIARAGKDHDRSEQDREVGIRDEARRRTERQVKAAPQQRDGQDQHRDDHEERLAPARVLVVPIVGTHPGQAREDRLDERSKGGHRAEDTARGGTGRA